MREGALQMIKSEFVPLAAAELKRTGFRKNGLYWYRPQADYLECVCVQGSQWDKDDYYVEIGFAKRDMSRKNPTCRNWFAVHRCSGVKGDLNITVQEMKTNMDVLFRGFPSAREAGGFVRTYKCFSAADQLRF